MNTILTFILVIISFALGVFVGRLPITDLALGTFDTSENRMTAPVAGGVTTQGGASASVQESVTVSAAQLSEGQRALLTKLGIDANAITITPAMIACAEAKLGAERLAEITGGATPSFTEGATLLACYR